MNYNGSGDLCVEPKKALKVLTNTSSKTMNALNRRSTDLRSEVQWRLTLRDPEDEA